MDAKTLAGAVLFVLELDVGGGEGGRLKGDCANTPVGSERSRISDPHSDNSKRNYSRTVAGLGLGLNTLGLGWNDEPEPKGEAFIIDPEPKGDSPVPGIPVG
jgi:hypothetical protein